MKKLKLNLGEIKIESFEISQSISKKQGTINGQHTGTGCTEETCPRIHHTCAYTCDDPTCINTECDTCVTCGGSCPGTCVGKTCDGFTCP